MTASRAGIREHAPTIYDVAEEAGVSQQTVSKHLRGVRVSPESMVRVDAAVAKLGYRTNLAARNLATRTSRRIAVLMYQMSQVGPIKMLEGASEAARAAHYVLDVVSVDPTNEESLVEAMNVLVQQDVAGILAIAANDRMRAQLDQMQFRVPLYRESEDDDTAGTADHPNFNALGAELAVRHLAELGHRRIAHISGPLDWPAARIRADSYRSTLDQLGLISIPLFEGDWSPESGREQTDRLLRQSPDATAVFVANDSMALGALHALSQAGVRVPADISVVGMDDSPEARFFSPPLTTIPMNFHEQGTYAFESMLARIHGEETPDRTDYVTAAIVDRASTARASR